MLPAKLYRYRPLGFPIQKCRNCGAAIDSSEREQQEKIVFNGQLYFPSRTQFNDPFDCIAPSLAGIPRKRLEEFIDLRVMESTGLSVTERLEIAHHLKQKPYEEITRMTQEVADNLGILSLSEKRDNILMWSHYANSHHGFCLEFDVLKASFGKAHCIRYLQGRYEYDLSAVDTNAKNLLLTKYKDWSYEKEWRVIADKGRTIYPFPTESLTGVIFGCSISETDKRKVTLWIDQSPCEPLLYQAKLSSRHFGLDIARC